MGVSKTDYMRGLQCPRMLWLDKHMPWEKVIPPEVQLRLDKGNEFGDMAMGMFGEFAEMTVTKPDGRLDYSAMIKLTQTHLASGTPVICEASFSYLGSFCSADILKKVGNRYDLLEVKNSPEVKPQHVTDLTFQWYVLSKCGVRLQNGYVVICGDDGTPTPVDVTHEVLSGYDLVAPAIRRLSSVKTQKQELRLPVGEQCEAPYKCWYWDFCHRN